MSLCWKRLAEEGIPIAAILGFWYVLAVATGGFPAASGGFVRAGVVMAGLYVAVRGAALSAEAPPLKTGGVEVVLRDNVRIAVSAGVWFTGAVVFSRVDRLTVRSDLVGSIADVFAGAGLGVVGLYAVAVGVATLGGPTRDRFADRAETAGSDDETPTGD